MLVEKPTLHKMAEQAIAELEAEGGRVSPQDVLWLHHLAEKVSFPFGKRGPVDWVSPSITVGNITLHELTLAGEWWVRDCAAKWWGGNARLETLACAWAMTDLCNQRSLAKMASEPVAWWTLRMWQKKLDCSIGQLDEAIARILGDTPVVQLGQETKPPMPSDWAAIVSPLVEAFGHDAAFWIFKAPSSMLLACMEQCGRAAHTDSKAEYGADAKKRAFVAFNEAVKDIRQRMYGEHN